MTNFILSSLPPNVNLETSHILKETIQAHRALAKLSGIAESLPNQGILLNTLRLQEAKDSSAIENIITTHDEIYKNALSENLFYSSASKEVQNYAHALYKGFELVKNNKLLTAQHMIGIQEMLLGNNAGFRKLPGTELKNAVTGETVYTPPQDQNQILQLMHNLEVFINDDSISSLDPLIKMAIIHYQFESIHPFYDGNGRTGRIINILYLILKDLLDVPILYLSQYIIEHKSEYYRLLQAVRDDNAWSEWIIYMLRAVTVTSLRTAVIIVEIKKLMLIYKKEIRNEFKFYSQELLNNLFNHPYTKIDFLKADLNISRNTAASYLDKLAKAGFLEKRSMGKNNYYVNSRLFDLLSNPPKTGSALR